LAKNSVTYFMDGPLQIVYSGAHPTQPRSNDEIGELIGLRTADVPSSLMKPKLKNICLR